MKILEKKDQNVRKKDQNFRKKGSKFQNHKYFFFFNFFPSLSTSEMVFLLMAIFCVN